MELLTQTGSIVTQMFVVGADPASMLPVPSREPQTIGLLKIALSWLVGWLVLNSAYTGPLPRYI